MVETTHGAAPGSFTNDFATALDAGSEEVAVRGAVAQGLEVDGSRSRNTLEN